MTDDALTARDPSTVPHVEEQLPRLTERLAEAPHTVVCLDFDGTLAPIRSDPDAVEPVTGTRSLLERLSAAEDVTVGIVSGRSLADVRERVGVSGVFYAGNHGLEYAMDGSRSVHPATATAADEVQRAVERLERALVDVPGVTVEDKSLTATVHYRNVPDEYVEEVRSIVTSVVDDFGALRLGDGKQIVELKPRADVGKDAAIERLQSRHPDAFTLYIGDDVTDEDAFAAVEPDGVGLKVGDDGETVASARLRNPTEVVALLRWVATDAGDRVEPEFR